MNQQELKTLQTAIFLLDNEGSLILENELAPYLKKAEAIKKILRE